MKPTTTKSSTEGKSFAYTVKKHLSVPESPDRFDLIATNAYYKAEGRGFEPGHELDDWLKAETEMISRGEET